MNVKTFGGILMVLMLAISLAYFLLAKNPPARETQKIGPGDYQKILQDFKAKIDDLVPTPPTAEDWYIETAEFVKDENLMYVVYHDTHNVFRSLFEIKKHRVGYDYFIKAMFEKIPAGWQLKHGEDLGTNKSLIRVE